MSANFVGRNANEKLLIDVLAEYSQGYMNIELSNIPNFNDFFKKTTSAHNIQKYGTDIMQMNVNILNECYGYIKQYDSKYIRRAGRSISDHTYSLNQNQSYQNTNTMYEKRVAEQKEKQTKPEIDFSINIDDSHPPLENLLERSLKTREHEMERIVRGYDKPPPPKNQGTNGIRILNIDENRVITQKPIIQRLPNAKKNKKVTFQNPVSSNTSQMEISKKEFLKKLSKFSGEKEKKKDEVVQTIGAIPRVNNSGENMGLVEKASSLQTDINTMNVRLLKMEVSIQNIQTMLVNINKSKNSQTEIKSSVI